MKLCLKPSPTSNTDLRPNTSQKMEKMDARFEPPFRSAKSEKEASEESRAKIDDLPILAFNKIFSYLDPQDRIKAKVVSRKWHRMIIDRQL